jgi:3'-phosphoadenosine 5'-phosphosulfate sulfotransferase (PAPS reductase)/FAD synthetase
MPPIIASVSGGKDSTALCLWLQEQGLAYRAVHMDTGWEHPETDRYIREVLDPAIGPIEWIRPQRTMVELIRHKGMFPARSVRFCTEQMKVVPIISWLEEEYPGQRLFNAVGIRADESQARGRLSEWQDVGWVIIWRPLLQWTKQDVIDIHARHEVPPNPLYLMGASRVGCWPCIFARKAEIRLVAATDPGRIDLIRALEAEVYEMARQRYAERGETFESLGYTVPSFFALKKWVEVDGEHVRKNVCSPIDEVVQWARTTRGGRQYDLLDEPDRSGCLRWGLCDS